MTMMEDVHKNYDIKPIIIVHSNDQLQDLKDQLKTSRYKFLIGIEGTNLKEIRAWNYGILLLDCE